MNLDKNVERKEDYTQVCVIPGVVLGDVTPSEFEIDMNRAFGTRIQYLETIETLPDMEDGNPVPETGGRCDIFFAVHKDDIGHFAVPRLAAGIRWVEDVLAKGNYSSPIYPRRVFKYKSWEA